MTIRYGAVAYAYNPEGLPLTPTELRVLLFIRDRTNRCDSFPTPDRIAAQMGWADRWQAKAVLRNLRRAGRVRYVDGQWEVAS